MLRTTWILNDRHLGFHRQLTFNKHFNEFVKIDLVENEVICIPKVRNESDPKLATGDHFAF